MILHVLVTALLASAQGGLAPARASYTKCLGNVMKADLKDGAEEAAFEAKLAAACKAEEAAFRSASIASDVGAKIARATAEQNANDEITYIRENTVEKFKTYKESNTLPR